MTDEDLLDSLLTQEQAAELAGVSKWTVRKAIRQGRLRGRNVGGDVWITTRTDVARWRAEVSAWFAGGYRKKTGIGYMTTRTPGQRSARRVKIKEDEL